MAKVKYADLNRQGETMIEVDEQFAWAYDRYPKRYVRAENIQVVEDKPKAVEPEIEELEVANKVVKNDVQEESVTPKKRRKKKA